SGYRLAESADVTVVELPYRNVRFAFTILLPKAKDGLAALEKSLSPEAWAGWIGALKRQQVALSLPKFVVQPEGSMQIKKPLLAMGMTLPFSASKAEFSRIVKIDKPEDRLHFTEVYHQAFVEVNEAGTEAAAATAVAMGPGSKAPAKPKAVAVDHPFLFVIRDVKTDTILFLGRVTDPKTKG
ncbi:MAG: serpin family protein, partial [Deltaproteobacteria bacterium]|nr:serpin family protein [Deltaproteobacteria bacterium]